jgi:hypothetical protein
MRHGATPRQEADYDLHGIVGVRLVGASRGDVEAVDGQLGPIRAPLAREPDIVVRFVERLSLAGPLRLFGTGEAGFTDDSFLVLRGARKSRVRVRLPLEQAGGRCELTCESGLPAVPLLIPLVNLAALANGAVPVHAAAFVHRGTGVLVTGWAKGGKTETLLAFMAEGATYVGDEWVYVAQDGERLYGIPEPIKVWDWHLPDLPEYRARLGRGDRARLRALAAAQGALRRGVGARPGSVAGRVSHLLEGQRGTNVRPERLFGADRCSREARLDKVVFVVSEDGSDVRVEPIEPEEIARRMVFSLEHERLDFLAYYLRFRFAFPESASPVVADAERLERELLSAALAGKEAYAVYHPYPAPIPALFEALAPLL